MEKFMELYKKYSKYVFAFATAYWLVVGIFGLDVVGYIFSIIGLNIIIRLAYIAVGFVGVIKVLELFKPELLEKYTKRK